MCEKWNEARDGVVGGSSRPPRSRLRRTNPQSRCTDSRMTYSEGPELVEFVVGRGVGVEEIFLRTADIEGVEVETTASTKECTTDGSKTYGVGSVMRHEYLAGETVFGF